jgi:hypothetical protein
MVGVVVLQILMNGGGKGYGPSDVRVKGTLLASRFESRWKISVSVLFSSSLYQDSLGNNFKESSFGCDSEGYNLMFPTVAVVINSPHFLIPDCSLTRHGPSNSSVTARSKFAQAIA